MVLSIFERENRIVGKQEKWIVFGLMVAIIAAHLINLGLMPLLADEAIRATVAFEMMQHKNPIVPTLWGDFYYRKPPLYNWIIIGFFSLFNSYSEFVLRLPSVLPLFAFAGVIWYVSRKHIVDKAGVLAGLAFVLSGRLLTRDSMLGHIDIFFSLVTFIGFFVIYYYHKKQKWWQLFMISYLLAAAGVLMKGLPSFLFQGLTLGVWFIYQKDWKRLLSIQHVSGIVLFAAIVGGYFFAYSQYNSLEAYFSELYGQAAMRTVVDKKWYEGVLNFFTFPFENIGHLLPTSLLVVFAIKKGIIKSWMKDDFTAFVLLTLGVNVIPYWLSPGYYPRYLFMLYPLFYILIADAYYKNRVELVKREKIMFWVFLVAGVVITIAPVGALFVEELIDLWYTIPAVILCVVLGAAVLWLWVKLPDQRIYWSLAFVVLFRLGFDFFVLPYRVYVEDNLSVHKKEMSLAVAEKSGDHAVALFDQSPVYLEYAFYVGVAKGEIIQRTIEMRPNTMYLVDEGRLSRLGEHEVYFQFPMRYKTYQMNLVKFKPTADE